MDLSAFRNHLHWNLRKKEATLTVMLSGLETLTSPSYDVNYAIAPCMESFAWKVIIHNANIKTKSLKSIGYQLVYYKSLYNWLGFHPPKPTQPTRGPFFNRHLKKAPPVSKSGGLTSRGGEGDFFLPLCPMKSWVVEVVGSANPTK